MTNDLHGGLSMSLPLSVSRWLLLPFVLAAALMASLTPASASQAQLPRDPLAVTIPAGHAVVGQVTADTRRWVGTELRKASTTLGTVSITAAAAASAGQRITDNIVVGHGRGRTLTVNIVPPPRSTGTSLRPQAQWFWTGKWCVWTIASVLAAIGLVGIGAILLYWGTGAGTVLLIGGKLIYRETLQNIALILGAGGTITGIISQEVC